MKKIKIDFGMPIKNFDLNLQIMLEKSIPHPFTSNLV